MKILKCGSISLDNKKAKICVPITGRNMEEIREQAKKIISRNSDIVEWRVDYYDTNNTDESAVEEYIEVLKVLDEMLQNIPIIFTFRTAGEGGEKEINFLLYEIYCRRIASVAKKYHVEFIDIEAYGNGEKVCKLIDYIKDCGVKVIGSNHHFDKTPSEECMVDILNETEKLGADICKLAVMPKSKEDVEALISVSKRADEQLRVPIITMAMGELGAVTRVCTRLTGSVITFASAADVSAPGQIDCDIVRELLLAGEGCRLNCNIVLTGFMGTGKTTVSQALAKITGLKETDVDKYIVEKTGMEIKDIFEQSGEQYFRELETEALKDIQKTKGQIISCGGGAVLKDKNVDILKKDGVIILLTALPETIFERVKNQTQRPVLNNDMSLENVKRLMAIREPRYNEVADIKINVDNNNRVVTCYNILKKLEIAGYCQVAGKK